VSLRRNGLPTLPSRYPVKLRRFDKRTAVFIGATGQVPVNFSCFGQRLAKSGLSPGLEDGDRWYPTS
jgi:hypothetical protein